MRTTIHGIQIDGVAAALPQRMLRVAELGAAYGVDAVERIAASTGITALRVAEPGVRASDLCAAAATRLLGSLAVDPGDIDGLVFVSQTPDRIMPATSALLQERLGLGTGTAAFDISYGCSGYIYGLLQAALLIRAGACRRVLLCAGDVVTPLLAPDDRGVRLLFGDAGSATLISRGTGQATFVVHTDGRGANDLTVPNPADEALATAIGARPGYLHMDGGAIMAFALKVVPEVIEETLAERGWHRDEVGLYGLHQANQFIIRYLRRKLAVAPETVPDAMADTGNTGPASIPLLLTRVAASHGAARRARTVLCGFGVGLSWGAAAVDLSLTRFLPMIEI